MISAQRRGCKAVASCRSIIRSLEQGVRPFCDVTPDQNIHIVLAPTFQVAIKLHLASLADISKEVRNMIQPNSVRGSLYSYLRYYRRTFVTSMASFPISCRVGTKIRIDHCVLYWYIKRIRIGDGVWVSHQQAAWSIISVRILESRGFQARNLGLTLASIGGHRAAKPVI